MPKKKKIKKNKSVSFKKEKVNYSSLNYDYKNRKRRQDVKKQYLENGSFYIFKPEILKINKNRLGGKIEIIEQEFWKSFEIDSIENLKFSEIIMKNYLLKK